MPCDSSYLEQNAHEAQLQRTAKLLLFVYQKIPHKVTLIKLNAIKEAANKYYCDMDYIPELCSVMKLLENKPEAAKILFNIHDKTARDLTNWWMEHKEADKKREKKEALDKKETILKQQALSKLSKEEKRALGL